MVMKIFIGWISIGSVFWFFTLLNAEEKLPTGEPWIIQAVSKGVWYGKPPLAAHFFDITLQNPAKEERWFLLPEVFPYEGSDSPKPGDGELAEMEVFLLSKKPKLVLASGTGSHFWAVKLPGSARVKLRMLPIESWWEHEPTAVHLEVVITKSILLDGKPFEQYFKIDPLSANNGEAKAPRDSADERIVQAWRPPESGKGGLLKFEVERRDRANVKLDNSLR
jgi:hypothetical protein